MNEKQQKLYQAYMTEIGNIQQEVMELYAQKLTWLFPDAVEDEIFRRIHTGENHKIYDCLCLRTLVSQADSIRDDLDRYMLEKLAEGIE